MKKLTFLTILLWCSLNSFAITVTTSAGSLANTLSEDDRQASELIVSGSMDARDFVTISEDFPNLTSLNLQNVVVESYTSKVPFANGLSSFFANEIPAQAFFGMNLSSVVLPSGITSIAEGAFAGTKIENISLPSSVAKIGSYAFYDCDNLKSLTLPASIKEIGDYLASGCDNLTTVDLSASSITQLPSFAFLNCKVLTSVSLPASSLTSIGESAFAGTTKLSSISLPVSLRAIGNKAFEKSGLTEIVVPENVVNFGEYAFANCQQLISVILKSENINLGEGVFFYCPKLYSVSIPRQTTIPDYAYSGTTALPLNAMDLSSVTTIGKYAFLDNPSKNITYGSELTFLDDHAMEGMTSLTEIIVQSLGRNVPELGEDVFAGINQQTVQLTVAKNTQDVWNAAAQWTEFKTSDTSTLVSVEEQQNHIKIWFEDKVLKVVSSNIIEKLQIYTADGRIVTDTTPEDISASIDTSSMFDNVLIIMVTTTGHIDSFKLMR